MRIQIIHAQGQNGGKAGRDLKISNFLEAGKEAKDANYRLGGLNGALVTHNRGAAQDRTGSNEFNVKELYVDWCIATVATRIPPT